MSELCELYLTGLPNLHPHTQSGIAVYTPTCISNRTEQRHPAGRGYIIRGPLGVMPF